jgi:predicted PurR-regulated permease PerM
MTFQGALHMEHDLLVMIYGAIMGVVGSILTSIVTAVFHFWLDRREYERRRQEEHQRQLRQIYLPTEAEVISINAEYQNENPPEAARTVAEAGSVLLSVLLSSAAVYQTRDPFLGFSFGACLGFLLTSRTTNAIKRRMQS